jgi:tetratricopeptide (TPR) repeat protein
MKGVAIAVAIVRSFVLAVLLAVACAAAQPSAQNLSDFAIPAEYDSYMAAINTKDPVKRAAALDVFIRWYPNSVLKLEAYEQAVAAWQAAGQPAKADEISAKLLQINPDNVRALANRVFVGRSKATQGEKAAMAPMVESAERGLVALARWQKPVLLTDEAFARIKEQMGAVFNGALGYAALQAKDYEKARRHYRVAVAAEPDNFQDVYQLAVSQLEGTPLDALGFWYGARSIAIARAAKSDAAAADIERYVRSRYRIYRGSEEGFSEILARAAGSERAPPANFVKSIPRALSPAEAALVVVEEHDPSSLSFTDWALVLRHRDSSPANKAAAEKVWQAITERQGENTRLKIQVKVISATPDVIEAAITDVAQAANIADLHIVMAWPLAPLPAVGAKIAIIGSLSDYRTQPFRFVMTKAELAPESLPVAGGPCADPRPQMCTRDYRPACGLRRDGTSQTYGNACSACSDPDVVTQAAGACP